MIKECSERRLNKLDNLSRPDITLSDYIVGKVEVRLSQNQKKKQRRAQSQHVGFCKTNLYLTSIELNSPNSAVKQISDTDTDIDAQHGGKDKVEKIKEIDVNTVSPIMTNSFIQSDSEVDKTDGQVARGEVIPLQSFGRNSVEGNERKLDEETTEEETSVSTVEHAHGFKQLQCDQQSSDTNVSIVSPNVAGIELYFY